MPQVVHHCTASNRQTQMCCPAVCAEYDSPTGEARLQQWGNRETNHHCVHAHCVNGGLGHDHELHPKLADDQEAVDAVTRQRETITRYRSTTTFAQDPDQASTAAPPDDERDLFGREEALRMDEEIMDLQWFEPVTWGQHQRLAWHDVCPTSHEVQVCVAASPTCHSPSHHSQKTQPLWPQSQLGKRWCSAAGSFWDDPQSTLLRATAHTSWMRDWSFFGLRIGLLSGPWYVLNVMLLRCRRPHAACWSSGRQSLRATLKIAPRANRVFQRVRRQQTFREGSDIITRR